MFRLSTLLGLVILGGSAFAYDAAKDDLQQFQGTWQATFVKNPDGQQASAEELKATRLVVKGKEFTLTTKDATISGTFIIDPSKKPKTIDFRLVNSQNPEDKFLGIYEIRGERRLSCFALPQQARPREMRPAEKGFLMLEWKRAE